MDRLSTHSPSYSLGFATSCTSTATLNICCFVYSQMNRTPIQWTPNGCSSIRVHKWRLGPAFTHIHEQREAAIHSSLFCFSAMSPHRAVTSFSALSISPNGCPTHEPKAYKPGENYTRSLTLVFFCDVGKNIKLEKEKIHIRGKQK